MVSQATELSVDPLPRRHRKKKWWRKAVSRHCGYALGRFLHALACRLPHAACGALSNLVGTVAYLFLRRDRRRAVTQLTRVLGGQLSPREIRRLARATFVHTASVYIEWSVLRRWSTERLERKFPHVARDLRDLEQRIRTQKLGVVGLTGHLGNWELLSLFFSRFTPGLIVPIANRLYFRKYHDFLHRLRTETGLKVIYNDESARKVIQAVRDGHLLGLLVDQEVRTNACVFVDFFGLPAQTAMFPVQLARKLGARLTMLFLVREGRTYRFVDRGFFTVPCTADEDADRLAATHSWTRMLEEEILKRPSQWSWMHDRWHARPDRPRRHVDRGRAIE